MYPVVFVIFGKPIYASPVFLVLGLLVGFFVGRRETRRREISDREFYLYWLLAVPAALLLAVINSALFYDRLSYIFANLGEFSSSGLVSFGAVIGTLGVGFIMEMVSKRPTGQLLDVISTILPLIFGVYRIGCILNGCCHGLETEGGFGIYLPNSSGQWANRYPTQIMLLAFDFSLFYLLWKMRLKNPAAGIITLVFLLSFSIFRLLLDSFRELPMVNDLINTHQIGSIVILLITFYALIMIRLANPSQKV